jgi:hypothetical protein
MRSLQPPLPPPLPPLLLLLFCAALPHHLPVGLM